MSFSLWYLLVPYVLVVMSTGLFLFFNVFHIWRYGVESLATRSVAVAYIIGYGIIIVASILTLSQFDWSFAPTFEEIMPFSVDRANLGL